MIHHSSSSLAAVILLLLAGPVGAETPVPAADLSAPSEAVVTPPPAVAYTLSPSARKAARFLDRGAFSAAGNYFRIAIPAAPEDAGLICQYVRHLILSRDVGSAGFVQTPIGGDHTTYFWATIVAIGAIDLASELEPKCQAYLADLILRSLASKLEGCISDDDAVGESREIPDPSAGKPFPATGSQLSMLMLGWSALQLDRFTAQRWAPRFEALLKYPVANGQVKTAVLVGALAGDLRKGAEGAEDFLAANRALLTALDNYYGTDNANDLTTVAEDYQWLFPKELQEIANGHEVDPNFKHLQIRLAEYGAEIRLPQ